MMMEEENPIEQVERAQEDVHHHATHGGSHAESPSWTLGVALSSAIIAAIASVAALFSGHAANHAMTEQIHASDHWSYYQAKSIKAAVLSNQIELLAALGHPKPPGADAKLEEYRKDQEDLMREAHEREHASEHEFVQHEIFSRAVTLFQVAIAISAVSVLTRRKHFWWTSLVFGGVGVFFFVQGLIFG